MELGHQPYFVGTGQVQQLLQELDTVNGTIRALDEVRRDSLDAGKTQQTGT